MFYIGIDIGSYLCRFVLAKVRDNNLYIINYKTEVIDFGIVKHQMKISDIAMKRLAESMRLYSEYIETYKKKYSNLQVRCVATAALRHASDAEFFVQYARRRYGIDVEIISPKEEIMLASLACRDMIKQEALIIDVGSGSTEFAYVKKTKKSVELIDYVSLNLGLKNNLAEASIRNRECDLLREFVGKYDFQNCDVIFARCDILKILLLYLHKPPMCCLTKKEIFSVFSEFSGYTSTEMNQTVFVGKNKAKLMKVGLPWVCTLLKIINCDIIKVSERGLKDGIVLNMALDQKNKMIM